MNDQQKARDAMRRLRGDYREFRILQVLARARTEVWVDALIERVDPDDPNDPMVIFDAVDLRRRGLLSSRPGKARERHGSYWRITPKGRRRFKELEDRR